MPIRAGTRRPFVIASVMAAMFMVAIEATIVSTAMPQIVSDLGGLNLYSWVFSAFLLTQTAATVVFGKLSDVYGRKPVLLVGIAIFLVGSVLCGLAPSMPWMIVFRLVQGVGAGAVQPVALTVVGDLYSAAERGKVQGWLASVWALSSVVGPLVGGLIVANVSWAWVFWINIPLAVAATFGFLAFLHETPNAERRPIDVAGALLFTLTIAMLMLALTWTGSQHWPEAAGAGAVFLVALGVFVLQERRAPDPIVTFGLWGRRSLASLNGASLLSGMALIGLTSFVPVYVQGVLGRSPIVAGFALTMITLGWPVGATTAARLYPKLGMRPVLFTGVTLIPAGSFAFVFLGHGSSPVLAGAGSLVMGLGMGLLSTTSIVMIQESVGWAERGAATSSNIFSRSLGSTLGATAFGAVLNYGLAHFGEAGGSPSVTSDQLRALLEGGGAGTVVRDVLHQSLHMTFVAVAICSVLILAIAFAVPQVGVGKARAAGG